MTDSIQITRRPDGVAVMTCALPGSTTNILTPTARIAFSKGLIALAGDANVRGIVITSAYENFMAGADLRFLQKLHRADPEKATQTLSTLRDALRIMEKSGKPCVAALPGTALGGGLEIALACHARIAANNPSARYGLPEVTLGLLPGAGGTQRLPRLLGIRKALPLMLKGTRLNTQEAMDIGLLNRVVAAEHLVDTAAQMILDGLDPVQPWDRKVPTYPGAEIESRELQSYFSEQSAAIHAETRANFPAPTAILSAVYEGMRLPFDAALQLELAHIVRLVTGDVAQNTVRTFFFGIGDARKGRNRPIGVAPLEITKLAILGAGTMGAGIAEIAADSGLEVVLLDRDLEAAEAGKTRLATGLAKRVASGRVKQERMSALLDRIQPTADFADLTGCGAVIEAVFESREIKKDVTKRALAVTGPDVLFASNTSKLPITGLAQNSPRPDRFIGMHFFSPVQRMELLEIIRGEATSDKTLAHAIDLSMRLRRVPIVVNDGPGFFTSRCVGTFLNEGIALLGDGVKPSVIENVSKGAGMPAGPLMLADGVGLDLMLQVRRQEAADQGKPDKISPEIAVLSRLVDAGRLGRKSGAGFYDHGPEGSQLWPGLMEFWPPLTEQPDPAEVRRRILHVQALEGIRCIEDGILDDPTTADVGSVLGWSFARHTGGLCSYVDMIGSRQFTAECEALAAKFGPRFAPPELLARMATEDANFHPLVAE